MPAKSKAQQRLFQAAAHGATFTKAANLRASMTPGQLKDFTGPLAKLAAPPKKKGK